MKRYQRLWVFLAVCLCLVAVALTGNYYVTSVRDDTMNLAINNILRMTQQHEAAFSSFIRMDRERVHSLAQNFTLCRSHDISSILSRIKAYDQVEATYTVINTETGIFYSNQGTIAQRMAPGNLAVYQNLSGSGIRETFISFSTGQPMLGYYECIEFADGVKGVFQKAYENTQLNQEFSLSFYEGQGFTFIVNDNGDILLRSVGSEEHYNFDNIFDFIDPVSENEKKQEGFSSAFHKNGTGTELFREGDDGSYYVYAYAPVTMVEGWHMVSITPLQAVMQEANEIVSNTQVVLFVILIIFGVIVGAIFFMWQYHRNIEEKDKQIAYKEQQFTLLSSFLSQNTDDIYIMMDKSNFEVEFVSPNIQRLLGHSQEEVMESIQVLGRATYKSKENIEFHDLKEMTVDHTVGPMDAERLNPTTGETRWFRETLYDVQLQDQEKIIVYISDRTAEQRIQDTLTESLEAVQVANRAKTTFLSSMSHDIRTPMNAIMGLITLIQEDADKPDRVLDYAHRIEGASHHLLELINNILDMNKIESGKVTLTIGELNLPDLIDNINTIIRPQAKARNQEFKLWASSLTSEHLLGDTTRINQILINLLSNAVKYTPEGGTIELTVQELPRMLNNYNRIQFVVRDNGQGMSEEYQKVMFDPFTREQNTLTNKIQGTGLGMAITKSLVDLMGGTIHVESKVGVGSTFTVELDLRVQDQVHEEEGNFWEDHAIARMIVADDDPTARESVIHAMRETGVEVHHAADGLEAIDMIQAARLRDEPYDLILLDWKMPNLDGLETARRIRKNYPHKIPILFFTGYDWSDIEEEAQEIGASHFLPKPFFMSTFRDAIRRVSQRNKDHHPHKEKSVLEGKHILVAEDIEVNRLILNKIMSSYGASCDMAENGRIVVEKFTASQPGVYDMVFMDIQMPEMNGYDATRAIRASGHPEAGTIPIIAMTANAFAEDVREALESGMDAHVSKPIVMDQLESSIRKVLEARAAKDKSTEEAEDDL